MKIETAMNHESRLKQLAGDVFWFARHGGQSHSDILKRIIERVYGDPSYGRVPGWVTQRLKQRIDDLYNRIYKPDLSASDLRRVLESGSDADVPYVRWQLRVDGKYVTRDEIALLRAAGDEEIWQRVEGAHIWNHKPHLLYSNGWMPSAGAKTRPYHDSQGSSPQDESD
jgi:hypothetical protein